MVELCSVQAQLPSLSNGAMVTQMVTRAQGKAPVGAGWWIETFGEAPQVTMAIGWCFAMLHRGSVGYRVQEKMPVFQDTASLQQSSRASLHLQSLQHTSEHSQASTVTAPKVLQMPLGQHRPSHSKRAGLFA